MVAEAMEKEPTNVGEALALLRETKFAIERADKALDRLAHGKPAILAAMIEPTLRIKHELEKDLAELERLAAHVDTRF
jgi:hypothetical protein